MSLSSSNVVGYACINYGFFLYLALTRHWTRSYRYFLAIRCFSRHRTFSSFSHTQDFRNCFRSRRIFTQTFETLWGRFWMFFDSHLVSMIQNDAPVKSAVILSQSMSKIPRFWHENLSIFQTFSQNGPKYHIGWLINWITSVKGIICENMKWPWHTYRKIYGLGKFASKSYLNKLLCSTKW